ncbi:hypothetical protein [Deinococcus fonticola]|uniref:hypothetical protein n=1 Tax=Deinococcus fonticola TaxID=2528713 RepID=UPI001075354D|nr:hypothetical protein [Deinococcus fonticola]
MHIFALRDELSEPENTEGLIHLGCISLQEHMAARGLWIEAEAQHLLIHPFEDTRLNLKQVNELRTLAIGNFANRELVAILDNAIQQNAGIISFVD